MLRSVGLLKPFRLVTTAKMSVDAKYFDGRSGKSIEVLPKLLEELEAFARGCKQSSKKAVVFVGENHEDPTAHELELEIFKRLADDGSGSTTVALSLEFYGRDVQPVMDEYLSGYIDYSTFLADSRPPSNAEDYRPLLEFCRSNKLPVVASNCARRYSRIVSSQGRERLAELAPKHPEFYSVALPRLPCREASEKYGEKFREIMGIVGGGGGGSKMARMLDAQSLWDASMADSIAKSWRDGADLVVHVCGYFHCQNRLGVVEHMPEYFAPDEYETCTVVVFPEDPSELTFKEDEHRELCDFLVLTDISKFT